MAKDNIKRLLDKVQNILNSDEHNRRVKLWEDEPFYSRDKFRRAAKKNSENNGLVPIVADPGPTMFARLYGFSVKDYYTKPEIYLENYLNSMIYLFYMGEDTILSNKIPYWLGSGFDSSFFGAETIYSDTEDPWIGRKLPLEEKEAISRMEMPKFERSGLGPLAIRFYHELSELLNGTGFQVSPPELIRAPFALAFHLRGFENLCIDGMTDPEYVHRLVRFITDFHKEWYRDREQILGIPINKGQLFNDEIDCSVISPAFYKEFALPYEKELSNFHNGIAYWHSCGNITKMLEDIRTIPGLQMVNISSWTDYETAARICPDIALEFCLRPSTDVYGAKEEHMERSIRKIMDICKVHQVESYHIRAGSLQSYSKTVQEDFSIIQKWINLVQRISKNL